MNSAASLSSVRYADASARAGYWDARLGRPQLAPPGRRQAAAYRAAYRAQRAAQS